MIGGDGIFDVRGFCRDLDSHLPGFAILSAASRLLAANLDETVRIAFLCQPVPHPIYGIAFRHSVKVQLHT